MCCRGSAMCSRKVERVFTLWGRVIICSKDVHYLYVTGSTIMRNK